MTLVRPAGTEPVPRAPRTAPSFAVISGAQVQHALRGREREIVELVEATYRLHGAGDTVDPPSYFLRFPDRPDSRIIALPASLGGPTPVDGLKWISSFPQNVAAGLPRASAVLILNDHVTGYPYACLESSIISATRTAASAAAAADRLSRGRPRPRRVGFVGTGLIARYIHTFLAATGWQFDAIGVYDVSADSAAGFRAYLESSAGTEREESPAGTAAQVTLHTDPGELIRTSDLVVFATVAARPHVSDLSWFAHHPLVLHVSLRDLAPGILLAAANIVDDADHCLRAGTSPHLAEQLSGGRDFVTGTLADVLAGRVRVPADRTVVFSPFGLGVLDLAVGAFVHDAVARTGDLHLIDDFFHELRRYG
ncbi:2,3-diaminopropionate biosynthesis protein SbnB [Streptomyces paromomycinus]|uniref:2,3-diaminopropionate biosynthesis protein SbnB n=1 Tax=Streptomyces paromomycinus TaxID=92743 RepID=A0A401VVI2_STREY|nr:2,3-diaminopropionate biosynthesis protein SbnB [Streptomyces paromomycinus]GCD41087.1 2,3-diaminopropionate biosynthesis protein SbnB [Streptomyces paromomycinus]